MYRRVLVGVGVLALLVAVGVAGLLAWRFLDEGPFDEAVAAMPEQTLRATYTDWSQVRDLADGGSLGAGSGERAVEQFLDRAYDADLTSTSAVTASTYALERHLGASPLTASWEMYGQSREGAVDVLRFGERVDLAAVEQRLADLGYAAPATGRGEGGVWTASIDRVVQINPALTAIVQNVVVLEEERMVLFSDDAAYASLAADTVTGSGESLSSVEGASALADVSSEPVSAVFFASDFACEALSMSTADEEDQRLAGQLVEAAGDVDPLSGLVMAHERDRTLVVGLQFASDEQAEENLRGRVELASGEAVGQGGTFPERFRISSAETDGATVVLTLEPAGQRAESTLLSDLSHGPVLFAAC